MDVETDRESVAPLPKTVWLVLGEWALTLLLLLFPDPLLCSTSVLALIHCLMLPSLPSLFMRFFPSQ
jgi:hypothetical protein